MICSTSMGVMDSLGGWIISYGYILKWVGFNLFILLMLALDLGMFNRREHVISTKEATIWSTVWIILALIFGVGIFFNFGNQQGIEYLTGYLIEKSLSVDNLFVFLIIFSYFKVEPRFQHSILFWGVLGALISRAVMIVLGAALIARFQWITYVFGAFLLLTGIRMFKQESMNFNPEENFFVRLTTRFLPITRRYVGNKFFIRNEAGRLTGTLLLLVLIVVDVMDLVFAVDSIPAIFAITRDPYIVYTSNIFAILGLRSLYFLLANMVDKFHYLRIGLAFVLTFIGIKMLVVATGTHIPVMISLGVVTFMLAASITASLIWPKKVEINR